MDDTEILRDTAIQKIASADEFFVMAVDKEGEMEQIAHYLNGKEWMGNLELAKLNIANDETKNSFEPPLPSEELNNG